MTQTEPRPVSELSLVEGAREVPVPYGGGSEYVCPSCERPIPNRLQVRMAKPPKYEAVLNDVLKCPLPAVGPFAKDGARCGFIFSPKATALVLRR